MPTRTRPIRLFYSYAAQDEALRDQLEVHLSLLARQGLIEQWHDRRIGPGLSIAAESERAFEQADVVLLLVSANFLASDAHYEQAVGPALRRHRAGSACAIVVLLRPVLWADAPFGELPCLPTNRVPVSSWSNPDEAWADVASGIRELLRDGAPGPYPSFGRVAAALLLLGGAASAIALRAGHTPQERSAPDRGHTGRKRAAPEQGVALGGGACRPAPTGPAPPGVAIASVTRLPGPDARFLLTAKNSAAGPVILDHLLVDVENCIPERGAGDSHLLTPLASYDLQLDCQRGCSRYPLPAPILLAGGDAVLLQVRLSVVGEEPPVDAFARDGYHLRLGVTVDGSDRFWPERFDSWALKRPPSRAVRLGIPLSR